MKLHLWCQSTCDVHTMQPKATDAASWKHGRLLELNSIQPVWSRNPFLALPCLAWPFQVPSGRAASKSIDDNDDDQKKADQCERTQASFEAKGVLPGS